MPQYSLIRRQRTRRSPTPGHEPRVTPEAWPSQFPGAPRAFLRGNSSPSASPCCPKIAAGPGQGVDCEAAFFAVVSSATMSRYVAGSIDGTIAHAAAQPWLALNVLGTLKNKYCIASAARASCSRVGTRVERALPFPGATPAQAVARQEITGPKNDRRRIRVSKWTGARTPDAFAATSYEPAPTSAMSGRLADHPFDHQTWGNVAHAGALCGSRAQ